MVIIAVVSAKKTFFTNRKLSKPEREQKHVQQKKIKMSFFLPDHDT